MKKSLPWSARMKMGSALSVLLFIAVGWFVWVKFLDTTWIEYHYPADGAQNIPLHDTVIIQWKQEEISDMGLELEYIDDPSIPIQGVTSGSKDGMSFMPEGFLPDKRVKATVFADWRSYSFVFTTAHEADQGIDLYSAIFRSYFEAAPKDRMVDYIAMDTRFLQGLKEAEIRGLAEGLLVYHPRVLYGSLDTGFLPIKESVPVLDVSSDPEVMLLRLKKIKEEIGTYEFELVEESGVDVLKGKKEEGFTYRYSATYRSGKWQVLVESNGK